MCANHARFTSLLYAKPFLCVAFLMRCSIELDDRYTKGYIRRAQANMAIGEKETVEQALRDLHKADE